MRRPKFFIANPLGVTKTSVYQKSDIQQVAIQKTPRWICQSTISVFALLIGLVASGANFALNGAEAAQTEQIERFRSLGLYEGVRSDQPDYKIKLDLKTLYDVYRGRIQLMGFVYPTPEEDANVVKASQFNFWLSFLNKVNLDIDTYLSIFESENEVERQFGQRKEDDLYHVTTIKASGPKSDRRVVAETIVGDYNQETQLITLTFQLVDGEFTEVKVHKQFKKRALFGAVSYWDTVLDTSAKLTKVASGIGIDGDSGTICRVSRDTDSIERAITQRVTNDLLQELCD